MVTLRIQREDMVSSSECVRNFSRMLDRVKDKPLFIVRNNDIEGIMMDIEEYEMLMERMEYLEERVGGKRTFLKGLKQEDLEVEDVEKERGEGVAVLPKEEDLKP